MSNIEWAPIAAVRGYAMLIEGKRIGLYNQVQMTIHGKLTSWGVAYVLISSEEWADNLSTHMRLLQEVHLDYASGIPPETATISRAFIKERKNLFPTEEPFYIGISTRWTQDDPPSLTSLQDHVLELYQQVEKCLES